MGLPIAIFFGGWSMSNKKDRLEEAGLLKLRRAVV